MTTPAKPGSLRETVETRIKDVPGYENLDEVLHEVSDGQRADYLAYGKRLIIEQKEQLETPEYRAEGRDIQNFINRLENKYRTSVINIVTANPPLLNREERRQMLKLQEKFYNRQNKNAHDANNQIASTKNILLLPDAVGALLLIFDQLPGMMPAIIAQRAHRDLAAFPNGTPQFEHIDMVIYACRMKDMTIYGGDNSRGFMLRDNSNEEHKHMILGVLDAFKGGADKPSLRINARVLDPYSVAVKRPDIFAETDETIKKE